MCVVVVVVVVVVVKGAISHCVCVCVSAWPYVSFRVAGSDLAVFTTKGLFEVLPAGAERPGPGRHRLAG